MLMADTIPQWDTCPRCKFKSFERLKTHSHCVNCNYSEYREDYSCYSSGVESHP